MSREGFNVLLRQRRVMVGDDPPGTIDLTHRYLQERRRWQGGAVPFIIIAAVVTGALIDDSRRRR